MNAECHAETLDDWLNGAAAATVAENGRRSPAVSTGVDGDFRMIRPPLAPPMLRPRPTPGRPPAPGAEGGGVSGVADMAWLRLTEPLALLGEASVALPLLPAVTDSRVPLADNPEAPPLWSPCGILRSRCDEAVHHHAAAARLSPQASMAAGR